MHKRSNISRVKATYLAITTRAANPTLGFPRRRWRRRTAYADSGEVAGWCWGECQTFRALEHSYSCTHHITLRARLEVIQSAKKLPVSPRIPRYMRKHDPTTAQERRVRRCMSPSAPKKVSPCSRCTVPSPSNDGRAVHGPRTAVGRRRVQSTAKQ